jgi:arginine exporter protein ArgO
LSPIFARAKAWPILDTLIAQAMFMLAARLIRQLLHD